MPQAVTKSRHKKEKQDHVTRTILGVVLVRVLKLIEVQVNGGRRRMRRRLGMVMPTTAGAAGLLVVAVVGPGLGI